MPASLESSRPIMAPSTRASTRASVRYSVYSNHTVTSSNTTDSAVAEIQNIGETIDRLNDNAKRLSEQRVELNEEKRVNLQKLALGAKLDRALDRRMSSQDAVMRPRMRSKSTPKVLSEKESEKVAAAA
ncbi:hypothetical protein N0V93_007103 [Gnomoniopsis smithogilvyi]|uniref:Uncharacterized protein n=1 Tax=Gnomoniopsis smithogilvyi TaxID=1191159 RepID=A0A9W9CW87_9PEZI|nr:hypothetical protein N0V93_007103 [Gnomoniopsis smithogilvyi]